MTDPVSPIRPVAPVDPDARLRQAAKELEAEFLSEMLKHAGLGEAGEAFGGGAGEEQFSSFLVDAQAKEIAENGGIGLAEQLYHSLKARSDGR